ncbi:hypothetical protein THAOC_25608, partial [Thalassiosira oceanica]
PLAQEEAVLVHPDDPLGRRGRGARRGVRRRAADAAADVALRDALRDAPEDLLRLDDVVEEVLVHEGVLPGHVPEGPDLAQDALADLHGLAPVRRQAVLHEEVHGLAAHEAVAVRLELVRPVAYLHVRLDEARDPGEVVHGGRHRQGLVNAVAGRRQRRGRGPVVAPPEPAGCSAASSLPAADDVPLIRLLLPPRRRGRGLASSSSAWRTSSCRART